MAEQQSGGFLSDPPAQMLADRGAELPRPPSSTLLSTAHDPRRQLDAGRTATSASPATPPPANTPLRTPTKGLGASGGEHGALGPGGGGTDLYSSPSQVGSGSGSVSSSWGAVTRLTTRTSGAHTETRTGRELNPNLSTVGSESEALPSKSSTTQPPPRAESFTNHLQGLGPRGQPSPRGLVEKNYLSHGADAEDRSDTGHGHGYGNGNVPTSAATRGGSAASVVSLGNSTMNSRRSAPTSPSPTQSTRSGNSSGFPQ